MKSIGQLMEEIGFKKDSNEETQKAFIKFLVDEAQRQSVENAAQTPNRDEKIETKSLFTQNLNKPVQLSFDLGAPTDYANKKSRKVS